jgi:hypothetical protein
MQMESEEDRQRFTQFIDSRTDCITVLLATFCSLNGTGAGEVRAKLEEEVTSLNNLTNLEVVQRLISRTGAPDFLGQCSVRLSNTVFPLAAETRVLCALRPST